MRLSVEEDRRGTGIFQNYNKLSGRTYPQSEKRVCENARKIFLLYSFIFGIYDLQNP